MLTDKELEIMRAILAVIEKNMELLSKLESLLNDSKLDPLKCKAAPFWKENERFIVYVGNYDKADFIMREAKDLISVYGFITVPDLLRLCGLNNLAKRSDPRGWKSIKDARIGKVPNGIAVNFPEPVDLSQEVSRWNEL